MKNCRATNWEMVCFKDAGGVCRELEKHVVHQTDGTIAAIYFIDPVAPLVPLDTAGWTSQGAAPCKSQRIPYNVCLAAVSTTVYKQIDCAGTISWTTEAGTSYAPSGLEAYGAATVSTPMLEKGYDVISLGLINQTCTEIEIVKRIRCDGTVSMSYFTVTGAPYVILGVVRWECPCVSVSLGVITNLALLG